MKRRLELRKKHSHLLKANTAHSKIPLKQYLSPNIDIGSHTIDQSDEKNKMEPQSAEDAATATAISNESGS